MKANYYFILHRKEYDAWIHAKHRCVSTDPKVRKSYLDKGITVDPIFVNDFPAFLAEVGLAPSPKHTLDRIRNDGNYEPGNLRWVLMKVQQRNKPGFNRRVKYQGRVMLLCELAELVGVDQKILRNRIFRYKWPISKSVQAINFKTGQPLKKAA
jgi:hypothetical protein